ncbi:hypothetical protein HAX54_047425 [Datura stramonium]|uniref:Uncharacterized protein n=1 Tax=Datura stramonium TaxID=4076 RepID=A0ABS8SSZ4_DATST|nr:hypothetical protein [Datura stramonium]
MYDDELKVALESCQLLVPLRKRPLSCSTALQLVSVFIFIFHSLSESGYEVDPKKDNKQHSAPIERAIAATFICAESTALREDHDLTFTSHLDSIDNFSSKSVCRSRDIFRAATKLAHRSSQLRKWISCDKQGKRFHITESELADKGKSGVAESGSTLQLKESYQNNCGTAKANEENQVHLVSAAKLLPQMRKKSFFSSPSRDIIQDEYIHQAPHVINSPSMLSMELKLEITTFSMPVSAAIHDTPPYVTPVPSAPLLPEDASWFKRETHQFSLTRVYLEPRKGTVFSRASPVSGYSSPSTVRGPLDFIAGAPGFVEGYTPLLGMSSSE